MKKISLMGAFIFLASCTHIQVKELDAQRHPIKLACIQLNPLVKVKDFVSVMESEFQSRDIQTLTFKDENKPEQCVYTVTYTARRSWDLGTFLSTAEVHLFKEGVEVAHAIYRVDNGFNFNKYSSTAEKMKPVYKKLFSEAP